MAGSPAGELTGPQRRLIADLYPPLRRLAAVVALEAADPDDLVQEAFLRVLRRGSILDLEAPLSYLRRTIINLAANHRRGLGRRRRALSRLLADSPPVDPEYPSDLSDLLRLSPKSRAVIYLVEVEGYPYAEVADMLGCTEAAARKRASRARRQLRRELAEEVP